MMLMGAIWTQNILPRQVAMALCQAILYIWQSCSSGDFCWLPKPSEMSMLPPKDGPYSYGCYMPDLSAKFVPVLIWVLQMKGWQKMPGSDPRCGGVYCAAIYLLNKLYVVNPDAPLQVFAQMPAPNYCLDCHQNLSMQGEVLRDHTDALVAAILCRLRACGVVTGEEDSLPLTMCDVANFLEPSVACIHALIKASLLLSSRHYCVCLDQRKRYLSRTLS